MLEAYLPTRRGFQTAYGYWSGYMGYNTKESKMLYYNGSGYMFYDNENVDFFARSHNAEWLFAERACSVIRNHAISNQHQPLFLYIASLAPHFPEIDEEFTRPEVMTSLSNLDDLVGRVVQTLIEYDLYNNTIIVFSSDNGGDPNFGGNNLPLRGVKDTLWEGALRVPAFIHSPLLPKSGVVSNQLIHVTDWLPTLMRAAGASPDKIQNLGLDGVDQFDALQRDPEADSSNGPRTEVIHNINLNMFGQLEAAYRAGPYKLLVNMVRTPGDWVAPIPLGNKDFAYLLYHALEDPSERVNLAANLTDITQKMANRVGHKSQHNTIGN